MTEPQEPDSKVGSGEELLAKPQGEKVVTDSAPETVLDPDIKDDELSGYFADGKSH